VTADVDLEVSGCVVVPDFRAAERRIADCVSYSARKGISHAHSEVIASIWSCRRRNICCRRICGFAGDCPCADEHHFGDDHKRKCFHEQRFRNEQCEQCGRIIGLRRCKLRERKRSVEPELWNDVGRRIAASRERDHQQFPDAQYELSGGCGHLRGRSFDTSGIDDADGLPLIRDTRRVSDIHLPDRNRPRFRETGGLE
jgi:hypothetical protein